MCLCYVSITIRLVQAIIRVVVCCITGSRFKVHFFLEELVLEAAFSSSDRLPLVSLLTFPPPLASLLTGVLEEEETGAELLDSSLALLLG